MIIPYLHLFYNFLFLIVGLMIGDWKNWKKYYSTIVFLIAGDAIHNLVLHDHYLWKYHGAFPPNHQLISLMIMLVVYPATVLIFLKYSLRGRKHFIFQWILWVAAYTIIEFINSRLGLFSYQHGWNIGWSILANVILFLSLRIHIRYPLVAWAIFFILMVVVIVFFKVPIWSSS